MNIKYFVLALLFLTNCAIAQVKQTLTKSRVTFQIKNLGINTSGSIDKIQANIQFDPANLNGSSIEATADMNTLNSDNDMRDEHLKSDEFFDVANYPKITMKSVSLVHKGGDKYTGKFNITIKNKTHLVDVPFTYEEVAGSGTFKGSFKLNRSDFDIGSSSLVLSDDLTVAVEVETTK